MVKLSIVIPTLNQEAPIGRAIQQFWNPGQDGGVEVIVADGGSQDGTMSAARLLADRLLQMHGLNGSWHAVAKNAGAAAARGDVLLFVDPEARLQTSVQSMVERFQKLFGNGRQVVCALPQVEMLQDAPEGCLMAVKRTAFLECGGFDEGLEEREGEDLLERIAKHGLIENVADVQFEIQAVAKPELSGVAA